ncbi:transcriptional regulator ROK family protein [Paenibacillus vortex V453]|uniref:Transcriptional regulator ROK family protein n=1 Tax=Paenibacillus vortex V453 TaxID=715225 RepID=A0A2R9SU59_9BACL|nr:ROK family transcriptional regulator [Paenibacillus vortex]EFU40898.1 transcriptional regulator ROK family protein [Paenibacillus vortex V453]
MEVHLPSTIRRMNKEIVLNTIKDMGPIARTEIAKQTGITKATVSDIVKTLIEEKLIYDEKDDADLSKRGTRLHFAKHAAFGIAVDLGGTTLHFGLFNLAGECTAKHTVATYQHQTSQEFLEHMAADIKEFIKQSGQPETRLAFISIATPGIVDPSSGMVLEGSPNLPEWKNIDLGRYFHNVFHVPVTVENDVRAALVGEMYAGALQDLNSAVLIGIGTGLGSAILIDGKVIRGARNAAGEIGYMLFQQHQLYAPSGKGHFEIICSGSGLEAAAHGMFHKDLTAQEVFEMALQGDIQARHLVSRFEEHLAMGILNIISLLNPEKILLMGGVTESLSLQSLTAKVGLHTSNVTNVAIEISTLQHQSALQGIAILGLKQAYPSLQYMKDKQLY